MENENEKINKKPFIMEHGKLIIIVKKRKK